MAEDTIAITESLRIERPAADVRAQYWDIDHHIRNNVHPGIKYKWEPSSEPGKRKIRTEFRLLGVLQYDISLLLDEAGAFVIDYLEGANQGTKLVHEFIPEGENATTVKITAHVPASTARKLLGPFFKFGVSQVIKKAMREDKLDLERGKFSGNQAAGNFDEALRLLSPLISRLSAMTDEKSAVARATLEVAALVGAADGEVDDAERDALRKVTRALGVAELDDAWADAALEGAAKHACQDDVATYAKGLGQRWKEHGLGNDALVAAGIVAQASFGVALPELAILRNVSEGAAISDSAVETVLAAVDTALSKRTS